MRTTPLQQWIAAAIGTCGPDLDHAELEHYQLARVQDTMRLARSRSPFYQRLLDGTPTVPRSLTELAGYPFTTATDVVGHADQMVCANTEDGGVVVTAEDVPNLRTLDAVGAACPRKRVYLTAADQERTVDFFRVALSTFTEPGDRVLILLPCERAGDLGDLLTRALRRLGARPIRHGVVTDVGPALAAAHAARADIAVGVPVQVLALARADATVRLKAVLLTTDHVPTALARAVENAWRCPVFNHYGLTETGLGGGMECEARHGYHLREADLYTEIIDPVTGVRLPEGAEGEVVVTTLTRTGMPLIRYRTGDLSRFLPRPCPCGTTLRTLQRVARRVAGVIRPPGGGSLALADLDDVLFCLPEVLDVEAVLTRGRLRDRLAVQLQVMPGTDSRAVRTAALYALSTLPVLTGQPGRDGIEVAVTVAPAISVAAAAKRRLKVANEGA